MAVVNTYKVHYHFEGAGSTAGKKVSPDQMDYVQAAAGDFDSIRAVLSSNTKLKPGTLVIDAVQNLGPSGILA